MRKYLPLTGPGRMGIKPGRVTAAEQALTRWRAEKLGILDRVAEDGSIVGVDAHSGAPQPGKQREAQWIEAIQADDGRWYLPLPAAKRERGWFGAKREADVDLEAEVGRSVGAQGRSFTVPAVVEMERIERRQQPVSARGGVG